MRVSKSIAAKIATFIHLNTEVVSIDTFQYALNVELEHGRRFGSFTNVTDDALMPTARIVVAHLLEFPDYYQRLKRMEAQAERYWATRPKPAVLQRKGSNRV